VAEQQVVDAGEEQAAADVDAALARAAAALG